MEQGYILRWEQIVGNRIVKKEKTFPSEEELRKFRMGVMQKKEFFKLLKSERTLPHTN